jgi:hypothetical protein
MISSFILAAVSTEIVAGLNLRQSFSAEIVERT